MRLDLALARRGLLPSRERAKAAILAGEVMVNGAVERRPSRDISDGDSVDLCEGHAYVGRGYLKLRRALDVFAIDPAGKICMDVGASTGGFTQLLLERGAAKVYAIDVGTGQLAGSLKDDPRVVNLEKTDFRMVTPALVGLPKFACVDVSFISLRLILPKLFSLLGENAEAVCLLKPQFETGAPVKHGIVKDPKEHDRVIRELCETARREGFTCLGLTYSPVTGGEGNIEFLLHLSKKKNDSHCELPIDKTVKLAWEELKP